MTSPHERIVDNSFVAPERRPARNGVVGQLVSSYLKRIFSEPDNSLIQRNSFVSQPWGEVVSKFTRDLSVRLDGTRNMDDLTKVVSPIVMRGMELVSGGVVSSRDLGEGQRRGLLMGGTWPDAPGAHFWDPRNYGGEQQVIREVVKEVLSSETDASEEHVGRVLTMSLPALLSWTDLNPPITSQSEVVDATRRLLAAEKKGRFHVVAFGCEPYQYGHAPNTTTSHIRRSEFGNQETLRADAVQGSFRGIRRILEPIVFSGVSAKYEFYTSFGTSWDLIQRQVMPDTINFYLQNQSPEAMLTVLNNWRKIIQGVGEDELRYSNITFQLSEMESEVVLPALRSLGGVLKRCGMSMPDNINEFCYNSQRWFTDHVHELNLLSVVNNHPDPRTLVEFLLNEQMWSRKHPEAYRSEQQRITQAALLSFFELHQYQRINDIIRTNSDFAVGIEIDEELIKMVRQKDNEQGNEQKPLLWGRPPRYGEEGMKGGVAHRQPWFYE